MSMVQNILQKIVQTETGGASRHNKVRFKGIQATGSRFMTVAADDEALSGVSWNSELLLNEIGRPDMVLVRLCEPKLTYADEYRGLGLPQMRLL